MYHYCYHPWPLLRMGELRLTAPVQRLYQRHL